MFGTFLDIIRNDHILKLYRGVRAHLHHRSILSLTCSTPALRIPPSSNNPLHNPLRRLRETKINLYYRQHLAFLPLPHRHDLHLWFS